MGYGTCRQDAGAALILLHHVGAVCFSRVPNKAAGAHVLSVLPSAALIHEVDADSLQAVQE